MIEKFRKHERDTGSLEVQVVTLTGDINFLQTHCERNPKDFSSKRGLIRKVNQRRRFMDYIKKHNEGTYRDLVSDLHLRK